MKSRFVVLLALLAACSASAQVLTVDSVGSLTSLDPALMVGPPDYMAQSALFEGLVSPDPRTSRAVPGVAKSWKISKDGKTITFKLRKSLWSDGSPVTARDFAEGWLRVLDPATEAPYAYILGMLIEGAAAYNEGSGSREAVAVKAVDDETLAVGLVGNLPYALDAMTMPAFYPLNAKAYAALGPEWAAPGKLVGNGPFVVAEKQDANGLALAKNEKYWDARAVKLKGLVLRIDDDSAASFARYGSGQSDWCANIVLDRPAELRSRKDVHIAPMLGTFLVVPNATRAPVDDPRIRKALAMAVDKKYLVEAVTGQGEIPADRMTPAIEGYPAPRGVGFDAEAARRLLSEAGFPGGAGLPPLALTYSIVNEEHKRAAEYLVGQWRDKLGIEVELRGMERPDYRDAFFNTKDFQLALIGWLGDYYDPNTFLDVFAASGTNGPTYGKADYDQLVTKAAGLPSGAERLRTLATAEAMLIERDQGAIPLYHYSSIHLIDAARWGGWYPNTMDIHPWKAIYRK